MNVTINIASHKIQPSVMKIKRLSASYCVISYKESGMSPLNRHVGMIHYSVVNSMALEAVHVLTKALNFINKNIPNGLDNTIDVYANTTYLQNLTNGQVKKWENNNWSQNIPENGTIYKQKMSSSRVWIPAIKVTRHCKKIIIHPGTDSKLLNSMTQELRDRLFKKDQHHDKAWVKHLAKAEHASDFAIVNYHKHASAGVQELYDEINYLKTVVKKLRPKASKAKSLAKTIKAQKNIIKKYKYTTANTNNGNKQEQLSIKRLGKDEIMNGKPTFSLKEFKHDWRPVQPDIK